MNLTVCPIKTREETGDEKFPGFSRQTVGFLTAFRAVAGCPRGLAAGGTQREDGGARLVAPFGSKGTN